ncbi:ABC transporter ATP-binding protein [Candidatus Sumerlaeota bacterium]|nr:ABC transporter ATP-binding protein [Candidatus Sumerlaeota bacterium]
MDAVISSIASPATGEVILSVRNASRVYKMGEVDVPALRDATLDLYRGELLIILGPSGSGKTTLLNLIGGMDRPTSGSVTFGDLDLSQASDRVLTKFRRSEVGFVFQFYNLVPSLTALENVQVASELTDDSMDPMEALGLVDLADRAGHFPAQLSGGEQQRVSLARAVVKNPQLMLCDEPTGALDIENGKQILALLVRMKTDLGKSIALITHNSAIAAIGDRVATLKDGRIASIRSNARPLRPEEVQW